MPTRRASGADRPPAGRSSKRREPSPAVLARSHVLITCYDSCGHQVEIPHGRLRRSFTGMQEFSRDITRLTGAPGEEPPVDVTILQVGPSSFDFQFDVTTPHRGVLRSRRAAREETGISTALAHSITVLSLVGRAAVFLAGHPDCEFRGAHTPYGPLIDLVADGVPHLIVKPEILAILAEPPVQEHVRAAMAVFADPGIRYVTLVGEAQGEPGMDNTVLLCNEGVREFVAGAPLAPGGISVAEVMAAAPEGQWQDKRVPER